MQKIQKVSYLFRIFFQILFVVFPLLSIILWIQAPTPLGSTHLGILISNIPQSIQVLHPLNASTKFLGFLTALIPLGIAEIILFFLIKLFRLYEKGYIFSLKNVLCIKYVGYTLLIGQLLNPLHQALLSGILTWDNPHGHRMMNISLSGTNFAIILAGLMIILISWIMAEGYKLQEDQKYTI